MVMFRSRFWTQRSPLSLGRSRILSQRSLGAWVLVSALGLVACSDSPTSSTSSPPTDDVSATETVETTPEEDVPTLTWNQFIRVCDGYGVAEARTVESDADGDHKIVAVTRRGDSNWTTDREQRVRWAPYDYLAREPEEASLVLCIDMSREELVETCEYGRLDQTSSSQVGEATLNIYYTTTTTAALHNPVTAEQIGTLTPDPGDKGSCPRVASFDPGQREKNESNEIDVLAQVKNWIEEFLD